MTRRAFATALKRIRPSARSRVLYRGVNLSSLLKKDPPEPLYMSGSANRFNRDGVKALYLGEDFATAYAETVQVALDSLLQQPTREIKDGGVASLAAPDPVTLFAMRAHIVGILDLTDPAIRERLGVTQDELAGPWRWENANGINPVCQQLGEAVLDSGKFAAIRYYSTKGEHTRSLREPACFAIFADRLVAPSFLDVADTTRRLGGRLP